MDWRMFFKRVKFSNHIIIFLSVLIIIGLVVISADGNSIISAGFVFFLGIIINYLKSMGLLVLLIERHHDMKYFVITDNIASLIIMTLFGYKYISILNFVYLAYISYLLLWAVYTVFIYIRIVQSAKYYIYYINEKKDKKRSQ